MLADVDPTKSMYITRYSKISVPVSLWILWPQCFSIIFLYFEYVNTCDGTVSFWHQRLSLCFHVLLSHFISSCEAVGDGRSAEGHSEGRRRASAVNKNNIWYNVRFYRTFITFTTLTSGKHRERFCIWSITLSQHFKGNYSLERQTSQWKDNCRKIWKAYWWTCQKRLWSCESTRRFIDVSNLRQTAPRHLWRDKERKKTMF